MKNIKYLLLLLIVFVFASAFKCGGSSGNTKKDWWTGHYTTENAKRTGKGATVYSYENVTPQNLQLVDDGLMKVFDIARRVYGYQNALQFSDYRVVLFKRSALCTGTAIGFAVPASNYDGTEWDMDPRPGVGVVCAAGLTSEFERPLLVVVQDDSVIAEASRFEGEHAVLYHNDRIKWGETATHTTGGHPLLPDDQATEQMRGGGRFRGVSMELPADLEVFIEGEKIALPAGSKVCLMLTK